jgi:rubredoxin
VSKEIAEPPEVVEAPTEVATTIDPRRKSAQVVGAITPKEVMDLGMEVRNICVECGWVHKEGRGVASCAACGGKTREGYAHQAKGFKAEDQKRFTGETATVATYGEDREEKPNE